MSDRSTYYLSVVLVGRNDGYGIDFSERFLRTLRFNHRELKARGVQHEFVLVEWAPPADRPLLADLVAHELPELSPDAFTVFIVDGHYQDALSLNPRLGYLEFIAKNVGVRRARGTMVLTTNCDVYFGREILSALQEGALLPRTVYRAVRHDLMLGLDHSNLDWAVLEDERNRARSAKPLQPPLMGGGAGDFLMLDRETFHDLRGFNEVYRLARIGIDFNFLVKANGRGITIADIGGAVYHINHVGSFRISKHGFKGREAQAPFGDARWHAGHVVYHNPPGWGLAEAPITSLGGGRWRLEFSWEAVPPISDLGRVVLPGATAGQTPASHVAES